LAVRIDPESESKMTASGKRSQISLTSSGVNGSDSTARYLHLTSA
jgi:hypothetical protein